MKTIGYQRKRCDFCGTCVAVCPEDAIELFENDLEINNERCTVCQKCVHICPIGALEVVDAGSL